MELETVKTQEQLNAYYRAKGAGSVQEKIDSLKKAMNVWAMCSENEGTPGEALATLEELALLGYWRAFCK
jgi:hypothetical protein